MESGRASVLPCDGGGADGLGGGPGEWCAGWGVAADVLVSSLVSPCVDGEEEEEEAIVLVSFVAGLTFVMETTGELSLSGSSSSLEERAARRASTSSSRQNAMSCDDCLD